KSRKHLYVRIAEKSRAIYGDIMSKEKVPIIEGLFTWPSDKPQLIASKCPLCGSIQFPASNVCNNPECDHEKPPEKILLSTEGTLYSYTIHMYDLRPPFEYHKAPFAIGAVEFPEGLIIVGRLTTTDEKKLKIGMKVRLKVSELYADEEKSYLTYFFEPVEGEE
ncbi:MAG: Zn-ribbon domain-containing OB-fold protein, partial [Candidatus Baldrarchaeia archaeon]